MLEWQSAARASVSVVPPVTPYYTLPATNLLVLRLDFDETNATQVLDLSGLGNHASNMPTVGTGPTRMILFTNTEGRTKAAYDLPGGTPYFLLGDPDSLSFGDGYNDQPFTICYWMAKNSWTNGTPGMMVIAKGNNTAGSFEYWDGYTEALGGKQQNYYVHSRAGDTVVRAVKASGAYDVNPDYVSNWTFWALSYYPTNSATSATNIMRIYIGTLKILEQKTDTIYDNGTSPSYVAMTNTTCPFYIGCYKPGAYLFEGKIGFMAAWKGTNLGTAELSNVWQNTLMTNFWLVK